MVYNKTFELLFAANEWAPHLRLCCVHCCVHVSCVSRLSWRACRAVLPNTARHDFFLCQNALATCRAVSRR